MASPGLMSSFTTWLSSVVSPSPSKFVLESTAGFHRGVRLELEPGDVRIGSTSGADIVLRDAGIAAEHAILRVGRTSIDLHAVGGEVRVGEEVIANGYGCALRAPSDLTIGEARLRISIERNHPLAQTSVEPGDAPARTRFPATLMVAGALLLAVPALAAMRPAAPKADGPTRIAALVTPFNGAEDHVERLADSQRVQAVGDETLSMTDASRFMANLPAADRQFIQHCLSTRTEISMREAIAELNGCERQLPPNPGPALNDEDAGRKLTERLNASGLTGLRVTTGAGQVVVTGSITKQQTDAWMEAQQWFDAAYRGRLVLVANVAPTDAKKPMPVVNVQAVWFGERPYIITAEGNRYYKGASLDNGWTIKDIADGRILLGKDGETLALVYRQ